MNNCTFTGRFTADPELTQTPNGAMVCKFSLAVDENFTPKGQEKKANFLSFVAWKGTAEFICKYFAKGSQILIVEAEAKLNSFKDKNDVKHYTTEFTVGKVEFMGKANPNSAASQGAEPQVQQPNSSNSLEIGNLGEFEEISGGQFPPF